MRFTKGHGTANDFVVLPDREDLLRLTDAQVALICDRRRGIGGDGILRIAPGTDTDWFMDYRNADGGAVEMCGNGIRVVARWLVEAGWASGPRLRIGTRDGVKDLEVLDDGRIRVDMGPPRDITELPEGGVHLSMGNPHVVLFTEDLDAAPVAKVGAELDREWIGGANVEFAHVRDEHAVAMRVWERGVGETYSCGTGACAVAVASHVRGRTGRVVNVTLPGGVLDVSWDDTVWLTGPAVLVGDGEIRDELLEGA